ncbi:MAG: hypothetical protein ACEY3K_10845 [Wolbachia sp.]
MKGRLVGLKQLLQFGIPLLVTQLYKHSFLKINCTANGQCQAYNCTNIAIWHIVDDVIQVS